jgi:hypothetical protein
MFGIESAKPTDDPVHEVRRLCAEVAAARTLDPATLDALSRVAGEAAARLRAEEERSASRRAALLLRLEASSLGLAPVGLREGVALEAIEQALDRAEAIATVFAEKELAVQAATARRDYKAAACLAGEAAEAQDASEKARAALAALLEDSPLPSQAGGVGADAEGVGGDAPPNEPRMDDGEPADMDAGVPSTVGVADAAAPAEGHEAAAPPTAPETAAPSLDPRAVADAADLRSAGEPPSVAAPPAEAAPEAVAPASTAELVSGGREGVILAASPATAAAIETPHGDTKAAEGDSPEGRSHPSADAAFWEALAAERPGLAKAILEAGALPGDQQVLLRALHLAALAIVADGSGEVDDRVREEAGELIHAWTERAPAGSAAATVSNLVLPAAGLLSILAPGANAGRLVEFLIEQPPLAREMQALARTLLEGGAALSGLSQSSGVLASLASEDERRRALEAHCEKVRAWLERNRDAQLNNYAPAKILWSRMLAESEPLGGMLAAVVRNDIRRAPEIAAMLSAFSGQDELRRLDIEIRGLKLVQKTPISFGAERDLNDLVDEVQPLLRDWTRLAAWTANRRNGAGAAELKRLREGLLKLLREAEDQLAAQPGLPGGAIALRLLRRFSVLLEAGAAPQAAAGVDQFLAIDVIAVPRIGLDPTWRMHVPRDAAMLDALASAARESVPVEDAIQRRVAAREFAEAVLALTLVKDADRRASLDRDIRNAAGTALSEMMPALTRLRSDAEAAEADGRLPSERAQPFLREIEALEENLNQAPPEDIPALATAFETLHRTLRDCLADAEKQVRDRITARLRSLDLARAASIRAPVERALAQGWLAVAEDLVERARVGEAIEDAAEAPYATAELERFFPRRSEALAAWLKASRAGIGDFISRPQSLPAEIMDLGVAPPERSLALARAWAACGSPGSRDLPGAIVTLFTELGFADLRAEGIPALSTDSKLARFTLRTAPLRDRETTLLPDFGSVANGSYTVLCLWRQPEVNQIRIALQKMGGAAERIIVLYFGVLTNQDRRELARMARSGQIGSVIVLDAVLALHLALTEQNRLHILFACTLPFSGVKPWSETGAPPPEMFFGRRDERQSIEATSGQLSHLVYGGRQLGKTALLRQIEGAAAGDPRRVVRYVDIKPFGNTVRTAEIWAKLAEELRPAVPVNLDVKGDPATRFSKDVQDWLNARPERSILLLLDEADKFFKEDQKNRYLITEQLRALSENTRRRFKPVFAGLENVQRMARDPNNPIAQLGTPLLIGPLLRGSERREAEALVRWPFAALGFTLAPEVVNRILIFANYYPSLIQLVCQRLLHALRGRGGSGPPWRVEMADLEGLLATPDLRRAAFEKFRITLELDQRYFLLALVVAELSQKDPEALAVGIPLRDLHGYAAMCWPAGFPPEFGEAAFDAVAEQMVGLGLLRALDGQHYALRSANLVHLIGSPRSISDQLKSFMAKPPPPEPDPLEDRRIIDSVPSLLTTRQEAEILGTVPADGIVVCLGLSLGGVAGGGAPRLEKAIREAAKAVQKGRTLRIETPTVKARSLEAFRAEVAALAAPRKEASLRLLLLAPTHGWTPEWVTAAHEAIARRPAGSAPLRFAFMADARIGWDWAGDSERRDQLLAATAGGAPAVVEIVPGLWNRPSLDVWLELHDPTGALPDWLVNDRDVLLRGTGGWDWALRRVCAAGRQGFAATDAAGLALQVLAAEGGGDDPLADLRALPDAVRLLAAVEEAGILRKGDEKVDATLIAEAGGFADPPPGLAWAQAVEVVVPGAHGLQLNPLLRAALPMLSAGLP